VNEVKPNFHVLNEEIKKKIFEEAKKILSEIGIFVENQECSEIFKNEGFSKKENRFLIPPDIVEKCLQSVPHEIKMYDREGKQFLNLQDDQVHFNPGSAAIFILDDETGELREPTMNDFIRFTKITDLLENIEMQSTALVYSDVPKEAQDWHRLYIALMYCSKPIITGTFRKESFSIMKELLLKFRTSEKDLANKPLAIFDACPSPPLKWSDLTTQSLIDAAKSMIPSEFVSMPLAGASAPMTLIGSITQHCAECLAGIVITQLTNKGAPVIWGGSPAIMDMKFGTTPMGAIETMMINIGNTEMGKFFNLPTHAYMSLSDSKIFDAQAGLEGAMGALLAGLTGINVVSGPGMLDFESTQSLEKLVVDNEIIGMVKRFLQGIEIHEEPFALNILRDVIETENFLSHPSTLKYFRKELFFVSPVIDRRSRDSWKEEGGLNIRKRAQKIIKKLGLRKPRTPIDEQVKKELDSLVNENLK